MIEIRMATKTDMAALYQITLATGHYGADAGSVYQDPDLLGHIFAAPYLAFEPQSCFVAKDAQGVVGFVVGTPDTRRFEARLSTDWWPDLRKRYPISDRQAPENLNPDQRLCQMIHRPEIAPRGLARAFPAHIHLNLLPRAQGQGIGRRLFVIWCKQMQDQGVKTVHVGASVYNPGAVIFWQKMGFETIDQQVYSIKTADNWYGGCSLS
ncbi:MAG: GNAT family N-acetyltransferase [Paracoccaceae bacterium]